MLDGTAITSAAIALSLQFARYLVVPVNECALRIVAPRPDMQFEKGREVESVRCTDKLKVLPVERRRSVVVIREPSGGVHNVFHSHEPARVSHRLVNQGLRVLPPDFAVANECAVDVVNAHGAMVRPAYAAERGFVAGRSGVVDVEKLASCFAHVLYQLGWRGMMRGHCVLSKEWDHRDHAPPQRQIQNG